MIYLKLNVNGSVEKYPYTIEDLKIENPNTSFPEVVSIELLNFYNIKLVNPTQHGNDYTKNYIELTPVLIDGSYYQSWQTVDAAQEEIDFRLYNQWDYIRNLRNSYLSECDWTQLPDSPLTPEKKEEWAVYRQGLRDVTSQPDSFNITWPVKPL